jgi:hypothetical protein
VRASNLLKVRATNVLFPPVPILTFDVKLTPAGAPKQVTLYNSWGSEVEVPFDRLNENIARVVVGED